MLDKFQKDVGDEDEQEEGESWNDYIIRRTREFNSLTRERPDDENSWLEFAKFQVACISFLLCNIPSQIVYYLEASNITHGIELTNFFRLGRMS